MHFVIRYNDVIMSPMASLITSRAIVYSTGYSGADQRKLQSSASLAFGRGIHRGPVNSPHKGPVTRKMFLFDDVIVRRFSLQYHVYVSCNLDILQKHVDDMSILPCFRIMQTVKLYKLCLGTGR